jgi:hypothetical protein
MPIALFHWLSTFFSPCVPPQFFLTLMSCSMNVGIHFMPFCEDLERIS